MVLALKIGEILSIGSLTTLIGMSITFITLILLVYILNFMKKLNKKNSVEKQEPPQPQVAEVRHDDAVVAAITAAITIILEEENAGVTNKARANFIVKSIKRI